MGRLRWAISGDARGLPSVSAGLSRQAVGFADEKVRIPNLFIGEASARPLRPSGLAVRLLLEGPVVGFLGVGRLTGLVDRPGDHVVRRRVDGGARRGRSGRSGRSPRRTAAGTEGGSADEGGQDGGGCPVKARGPRQVLHPPDVGMRDDRLEAGAAQLAACTRSLRTLELPPGAMVTP